MVEEEKTRKTVREKYAKIAKEGTCISSPTSCNSSSTKYDECSREMGYTEDELKSIPQGSNLGQGCGNPVALASLKEGEIVIDLGSGAGVDCFLAAKKVGAKGRIIGIDMTPAMVDRARENARKGNYENVEFRLGEIENLPVANNTADVIISNCVITLVPNKKRVYKEAFRALKPGGKLIVSDLVLTKPLPAAIKEMAHPASSIHLAMMKDKYLRTMEQVGFKGVKVVDERQYYSFFKNMADDLGTKNVVSDCNTNTPEFRDLSEWDEKSKATMNGAFASIVSIDVFAVKPS